MSRAQQKMEARRRAEAMIQAEAWPGFFLIGEEFGPQVCCWEPSCGLMQMLIEDDLLHAACVEYLLGHGALRFATWQDAEGYARAQEWPRAGEQEA